MSAECVYFLDRNGCSVNEFRTLLEHCGARAASLPDERLMRLLSGATFVITARVEGRVVGIARAISDGAWVTHLSQIFVHEDHRGCGIGRKLVEHLRTVGGEECAIVLQSNAEAKVFYERLGFAVSEGAYSWPRGV